MSLLDQLTKVVASQVTDQASQRSGVSQDVAAQLMPIAMAVLMNGLKKNASTPAGAEALARALDKHDGSLLNNVGRLGEASVVDEGQKILGHILGAKRGETEAALAKSAGVNPDQIGALLAMAAPAVLASLGRARREQGLDASALAGLVTEEGVRAQKTAPNQLGGLMQFLDADGDGDFEDDLEGIGKSLFKGLMGGRR